MVTTKPAAMKTTEWLTNLYQATPQGWLTIWALNPQTGQHRTLWTPSHQIDDLLRNAKPLRDTHHLYFGVSTRQQRLAGTARGGETDCAHIPALWLDIDTIEGHGKHDNPNLPPTLADAYTLIDTFPLPPTSIIETGGGLQAWWALDQPIDGTDARPILDAWNITWQHAATLKGWAIDNVHDMPRVMRLPGTLNHRAEPPAPVTIVVADWTRRYPIDELTQWLTPPEPVTAPSPPLAQRDRPGDQWAQRVSWRQLLEADGWTWHHHTGDEDHWTRPGKTIKDGTSATTNYQGSDVLKVFTSNAAPLLQGETYNKFHYLTVTRFGGDHTAATRWLAEQGYGSPTPERIDPATLIAALPPTTVGVPPVDKSWVPYDLAPYANDDYEDPTPNILTRPDGRSLIYPDAVNALFGAPGVGKTWVALAAITQHLQAGHKAAFIDLEDHPRRTIHPQG